MAHQTASAQVRARLNHPVVDADGHLIELTPIVLDYVRQLGGSQMVTELEQRVFKPFFEYFSTNERERRDKWMLVPAWWSFPTKSTLDRMTVCLPKLLHERLDEMGIDFAVLYPTLGVMFDTGYSLGTPELRKVAFRALNLYMAELFGKSEYADRMTPVAVIPMFTPRDALEELDYAVGTLGFKAVLLTGYARRGIPAVEREYPGIGSYADRLDTFGIDSDFDYDPVWAKCAELKVSPTFHSSGRGWGSRRSFSNYTYNHIGQFAAAGEALCKSLFMNGVTRRFPELRFGFLEGGVGWASNLYADLVSHWEKRNPDALNANTNPANLDVGLMMELSGQYGCEVIRGKLKVLEESFGKLKNLPRPENIDDFSRCRISNASEIAELFGSSFYFGCEADDPMNVLAFDTKINPFATRLNAMLGSDIGHFDVPDITSVVAEAYELLEHGLCDESDFQDFVCGNAIRFYGHLNTQFFNGTPVASHAKKLLLPVDNK